MPNCTKNQKCGQESVHFLGDNHSIQINGGKNDI